MAVTNTLTRNVGYWLEALKVISRQLTAVTVQSGETLEISDAFFDVGDPAPPLLADWVQVPARGYDLLLEDGKGTIHLANLSGRVAYAQTPGLVTWYGFDQSRHEVIVVPGDHAPNEVPSSVPPTEKLLWFAWDIRCWDIYVHDGKTLSTLAEKEDLVRELDIKPCSMFWLGWDGKTLDLFDCQKSGLPANLSAVFVGATGTVGAIRRKI